MRVRVLAILVVTTLALAGCGGGDASGPQGDVAEQTIAQIKSGGGDVDEGCVHDAAKGLSDADATAILNDGEISEAGEEIGLEMLLTCTGIGDLGG